MGVDVLASTVTIGPHKLASLNIAVREYYKGTSVFVSLPPGHRTPNCTDCADLMVFLMKTKSKQLRCVQSPFSHF